MNQTVFNVMFSHVKNFSTLPALASMLNMTVSLGLVLNAKKPDQTTDQALDEDPNCPVCLIDVNEEEQGLQCDRCVTWFHCDCIGVSDEEYQELYDSEEDWFCVECQAIRANKLKWGTMEGEDAIRKEIKVTCQKVVTWRGNLFMLPRGKCGSDFIKELTRLINDFVNDTKWKRISLTMLHIFIPIMLQKPAPRS